MQDNPRYREYTVQELKVMIYSSRQTSGYFAAKDVAECITSILFKKDELRIIFAAAPSQNEFLNELIKYSNIIDWGRITAFHMDEYVGLKQNSIQSFGKFLGDRIFNKVPFKEVHYINPDVSDTEKSCMDYSKLLNERPIDIVCMGIGENGHIAFNDPPYADFNDPLSVKIVKLDEVSRQQQVNDNCFSHLDDVPKEAITLTIPALFSAEYLFVVVPGKTKANAVKAVLEGPITESCPATILRKHKNAKLYLDEDSSSLLSRDS